MKKLFRLVLLASGIFISMIAQAQNQKVSGRVTGSDGSDLPGVTVSLRGTSTGTITDGKGSYQLTVPSGQETLVFSFIGMKTVEKPINNQGVINVQLVEDVIGLEEVIAVGYGTMRKSDLTGSITTVKSESLTMRPTPTIASALQGQASGVLVRTQSAAPGGGSSITIRGINSVQSGSGPLFVVDGIPLSNINSIAPEDIESLEVLKDASATAIYGSRGSNGVILITSKKGKKGKTSISYNARYTMESMPKDIKLMNGQEFADFYTEYERTKNPNITQEQIWYNGSAYDRPTPEQAGAGTNWWEALTRSGQVQNHQLAISGGSDKNTFSVSLNYLDHEGMFIGGDYRRFGLRTSNTYEVTNWLSAGLDIYITRSVENSSGENTAMEGHDGTVNAVYKMSPAQKIYNEDGTYAANTMPGTQTMENPIALAKEQTDANRSQRAFGNFYLDFKPVKDLSIKISAGGDANERKSFLYNPTSTIYGGMANGIAQLSSNIDSYFINENIITYKKQIDVHRFDVVAGLTYEQNIFESFRASSSDFFTDAFKFNNLGAGNVIDRPASNKNKWSLASGLGRFNYSLSDKYLLTLSGRYDGSSKFGEGNKWGFFPSAALAWRVSEESFMQSLDWLSFMKVRGSYGSTGNANIGLYQSLATFAIGNYPLGTAIQPGVYIDGLENKDLKWETTTTGDLGVDFGIFNKVNITIDAYYKKTSDLLMNVSLIETSGQLKALRNVGSLENKGLEFSADAVVVDRAIKWKVKGDIYTNKNKILTLNNDATQEWKIGESLGVIRGYVLDGILGTQADLDNYKGADGIVMNGARLGDYRIVDTNKDGKISGEDQDIICDPNPDFTYSLNNELSYKNFSLSVFIYGTQGNQIQNITATFLTNLLTVRNNMNKDVINNYWTPEHTTGVKYAALNSNTYTSAGHRTVENGSFLRVQNIMLSYNLPLKQIFKNARIYASAQNLLTISDYSGFDPDISSDTGNQNFGTDRASYPLPKSVTFGIDITL